MKKITITVIIFALMLSLMSCNQTRITGKTETSTETTPIEPITPSADDRILGIYELDPEMYSSSSTVIRNPLVLSSTSFLDVNVAPTKQFSIGQQMVTASYMKTTEFVLGDSQIEMYSFNKVKFGYREDGKLYAVSNVDASVEGGFAKIELGVNDSLTDIRSKLTNAVHDWIDLNAYDKFKGVTLGEIGESGDFLDYNFYNIINGFIVDSASISVKPDGSVFVIQTHITPNVDVSILETIDKDYEREVILAKLRDMYEINGNKLASDEYNVWGAYAVQYEGELYIEYTIYTNVITSKETTEYPGSHLLVPVSALIPPTTE